MEKFSIKNELGMSPEEFTEFIDGLAAQDEAELTTFLRFDDNQRKIAQRLVEERVELLPESHEKKAAIEALEKMKN